MLEGLTQGTAEETKSAPEAKVETPIATAME